MNDRMITEVSDHKHLGLSVSMDGSFRNHIDIITEKAFRRLNILRKLKFVLNSKKIHLKLFI